MNRFLTSLLTCALISAGALAAAQINFTASVDKSTVGLGEQFTLSLTVDGEDLTSVPRPVLPDLADFNVHAQSQSSGGGFSIQNGKLKRQVTVNFSYVLSATKLGTAEIPACKLTYAGTEYQSQPIAITVVKASQAQAAPRQRSAPGGPTPANVPVEGNLSIEAAVDRTMMYVGEQFNLRYDLYSRLRISRQPTIAIPVFSGFWKEDLKIGNEPSQQTVSGKVFNKFPIFGFALFPMSPGRLEIQPLKMAVPIVVASRDPFDLFGTETMVEIESKPLTITVLPLPEPKPANFSDGVGRFTIASSLDRTATSNSEPITLTISLSGTGNIRLIAKPAIPPVPGLRILDPEIKEDIRAVGGVVRGTRTFRYPIIPRTDGRFVIPAVSIAYFDPAAKAYRTISTERYECTATGCVPSASVVEATGLKVLGTDINHIKPDAAALRTYPPGPSRWLWAAYILSLGLVGGSFWLRGFRDRLASDRGFARKARSSSLVRKRLKTSASLLKRNDLPAFHAALAQAVAGYAGDRFDLDTQAMTKEQLRDELAARGIPGATVAEIVTVLEQCELARFSPGMLTVRDPAELLARAKAALDGI